MNTRLSLLASLTLPSVLMVGCAHKKAAAAAPATMTTTASATPASPTVPGHACHSDLDCGGRQLCIRSQCVDITANLPECSTFRVQFDLDSTSIHPDDQPNLQRMARCLQVLPALHVTIEGNADERGTDEYNMALGDKRATTVGRYLESLGASKAQLKTISFGKERPLCVEHDEDCWSKNRRAAIKSGGGR